MVNGKTDTVLVLVSHVMQGEEVFQEDSSQRSDDTGRRVAASAASAFKMIWRGRRPAPARRQRCVAACAGGRQQRNNLCSSHVVPPKTQPPKTQSGPGEPGPSVAGTGPTAPRARNDGDALERIEP